MDKLQYARGFGPFLGRLLISLIFIFAGIGKIFAFDESVVMLTQKGVSAAPLLLTIAILLEIVGGVMILFGWFTKTGCILLMIFLLPSTVIMHNFWDFSASSHAEQLSHFLKNLTIYGGLILLLSYGPGRWSIDHKHCCHHQHSKPAERINKTR